MNLTHCAIFLTRRCNLACHYCYRRDDSTENDLTPETGRETIDFLLERAGKRLSIAYFGGEPLLRFDLIKDLTAYAQKECAKRDMGISFSINTNGIPLDREKMDFILENNIGLAISLDGTPQSHDLHRVAPSGKGCFHLLQEKLPLILENPRRVHTRMTVTPDNAHAMFDGVKYIHGLGFRSLAAAMDRADEGWTVEKREIFRSQYKKVTDWYMDLLRQGDRFAMVDLDFGAVSLDYPQREKGMPCEAGQRGIAVDTSGIIYSCYRFVGLEETAIGHIKTGFDEEKRNAYLDYSIHDVKKCRDCPLNFRCHRCPWLSYIKTGDLYMPVEINCFEGELMIGLFRYFRKTMEDEGNSEFLKRSAGIKSIFFKE